MAYSTKQLHTILPKTSGRDNAGHVSIRSRGGRQKRYYRQIDWLRDKINVPALVEAIEYDPNRSADIALLKYQDGERRYILCPVGMSVGDSVVSGEHVPVRPGNSMPLRSIPVGTMVHNLEIKPGRGGQMARSAGTGATLLSVDGELVQIKLSSGEIRLFHTSCKATIGQLGNIEWKNRVIGKAGTSRLMGRRPHVRGVAQNPRSHPHGGGEGRSGIGLPSPKSPWGKPTLGNRTRKRIKYSDKHIVSRRNGKK